MESKGNHPLCPAVEAIRLVGTEWRLGIVRVLLAQPLRFSDIERYLDGVDPKSLTRVLRALEETGIVERIAHPEGGHAYSLTKKGRALEPVTDALAAWGRDWIVLPQATSSAPSAR
jgi:DNA-binding HxlR family transcriptional regulator